MSVISEPSARSADRRAAPIAWAAMLLGSILPRVLWSVFAHEDAPPLVLIAQLVALIGHYSTIGSVANAFDVRPPDGSKTF